jgi:hypothetical protein
MKKTFMSYIKFKKEAAKESTTFASGRIPKSLHAKVVNALDADGGTLRDLIEAACIAYLEERSNNVWTTQK